MSKREKQVSCLEVKLHQCDKGVTCDEFTTLFIAETPKPPEIKERMEEHKKSCPYHRSSEFHQSMLSSHPDMDAIERHTEEIIKKYEEE